MDFQLSDEQRAFAEMARAFAREEWLPHAPGWDERTEFPVEALRRAAELGFAGIYVGDEFGGSGLGRIDATIIFEELAAACVSTAAYLSIHNMAAWMIDGFGTREQRARFLPKLMTMQHFASYCLTEPGGGSNAARWRPRDARRRSLRAQRHQGVHLRRRGQ
jgi:alkylation response protein AidB-like acyl-CoA dehydrogenase